MWGRMSKRRFTLTEWEISFVRRAWRWIKWLTFCQLHATQHKLWVIFGMGGCLIMQHSRFLFTVSLVDTSDALWLELVVLFWFILFLCAYFPFCDSKIGPCRVEKMQAETCHRRRTLLSPGWNKTIPVRHLYLEEPSVALACWVPWTEKPLSRMNDDLFISCFVLTLL